MTRFRVLHRTTYRYDPAVTDGYTVAYLLPRPTPRQTVEDAEVHIEPAPDERAEHIDVFGNRALQFGIHRPHDALTVRATSAVDVEPTPAPTPGPHWEAAAAIPFTYQVSDGLSTSNTLRNHSSSNS